MYKWLRKKFTVDTTEIPLFYVNFNEKLFKKNGKENSCMTHTHPKLKGDKVVEQSLKKLIDYIRDNYNMEDM